MDQLPVAPQKQLKEDLGRLYGSFINYPINVHFVMSLCDYVEFIKKSPILINLIDAEHEDLRDTRIKIPKARDKAEYEMVSRMLKEKLFTNISEDYIELTYIQEALWKNQNDRSTDNMFTHEIKIVHDFNELKEGKTKKYNYFLETDLRTCLVKVHAYLINSLFKLEERTEDIKSSGVRFDEPTGTLFINDQPVRIRGQKRITDQYRIMNYIFSNSNLKEEFFYHDIAEGISDEDFKLTKYTTACEKFQNKILKTIGIKDFLIFNYSKQGSVQVNPKYLL